MQLKKQQFLLLALICLICSCVVIFTIRLADAKQHYRALILQQIQLLLDQQQALLQRLEKQLIQPIQEQNTAAISQLLRVYEDQIFVLAKQDLTVPLHIQWVRNGHIDEQILAPDEDYYLKVVADPAKLAISKNYIKPEMPEHILLNMGLGIIDDELNNLGHLDVSVSLEAISNYVTAHVVNHAKFFTFKLSGLDGSQVEIILLANVYWAGVLKFTVTCLLVFCLLYAMFVYSYRLHKKSNKMRADLTQANQQNETLTANLVMQKAAADAQYKYGALIADPYAKTEQIIYIQSLLDDVKAVNYELASTRNIHLNFPNPGAKQLHMLGNKLRLMQILSGILCEVMHQLPAKSTVTLQVQISDLQPDLRKFLFKFSDDGFYTTLHERQELASAADIRAKGWHNILQLIELEQGVLEHVHTSYSGNTISFAITRQITSNVVSLERYLEEA